MKSSTITTLAAILVIGAGGYFAGRISSSPADGGSPDARSGSGGRSARISGGSTVGGEISGMNTKSSRGERPRKSLSTETSETRLSRLESIVRGEDPLDRTRAMLDFIDQLGPGDFESAIAHFRSLGITEQRFGEYGMLLSAWAKLDPMAALDFAKANTRSPFATNTILATWAVNDPEAAINWAKSNHEGESANPYMPGIIRSLAATDPTRASQLLTEMPRSAERGQALDALLPHLLRQGTEVAKNWISGLTDEALRNGAMTRTAEKLAEIDPAGTAAWLLTGPSDAKNETFDNVYTAWVAKDKQAALSSLAALPAGEDRSNALRGAIRKMATENPSEAAALMNRYPGDVNDRLVRNYVWHSFDKDPGAAIGQIARMTDANDRDRTYARTVGAWLERDPAAATSWMQVNPLPPAVIQSIQKDRPGNR
jgi:hypothetical protein